MSEIVQNKWESIGFHSFPKLRFNPYNSGRGNYSKASRFITALSKHFLDVSSKKVKQFTFDECLGIKDAAVSDIELFKMGSVYKVTGKHSASMKKDKYSFQLFYKDLDSFDDNRVESDKKEEFTDVLMHFLKPYNIDDENIPEKFRIGTLVCEKQLNSYAINIGNSSYGENNRPEIEKYTFISCDCKCFGERTLWDSHICAALAFLFVCQGGNEEHYPVVYELSEGKKNGTHSRSKGKLPWVTKLAQSVLIANAKYKPSGKPSLVKKAQYLEKMVRDMYIELNLPNPDPSVHINVPGEEVEVEEVEGIMSTQRKEKKEKKRLEKEQKDMLRREKREEKKKEKRNRVANGRTIKRKRTREESARETEDRIERELKNANIKIVPKQPPRKKRKFANQPALVQQSKKKNSMNEGVKKKSSISIDVFIDQYKNNPRRSKRKRLTK